MVNKIIYNSAIDRVFCENGETFTLEVFGIQIKIKGGKRLVEKEAVAYFYDYPHYPLKIELTDLEGERLFLDFKNKVEKVLDSFTHWLIDIKGVKINNPVFLHGFIDEQEVNEKGENILGSDSITIYEEPSKKEISIDDLNDVFVEIDVSDAELNYLKNSEELFRVRREIFLSNNNTGNFVGLYAFLHELLGNEYQKETDKYLKNHSLYDRRNNRKTTKSKKRKDESIFTWLRNQIGHLNIASTDINQASEEIDGWHEKLYDITLEAIKEKNGTSS